MAKNKKKSCFSQTVRKFEVVEIWSHGKHLVIIRPYEYNVDIPGVMRFNLVPHLSRFVAMERRKTASDRQTT